MSHLGPSSLPPTERVLDTSRDLHLLDGRAVLERFESEDASVVAAVHGCSDAIVELGQTFAEVWRAGGRIFHVGAGTSGRLGFLDAAEWGPTFGVDRARLVAVLAGGAKAFEQAVEGAEDRADEALQVLASHRLEQRDVVVGISASGAAAFVRAALDEAQRLGCPRAAITCNGEFGQADTGLIRVILETGPEIVTGSTRLKAALATHMVLQRASNICAVALGWIYRGQMVEMRPTNQKLRERARRIVADLGQVSPERAQELLEDTEFDIKVATVMARLDLSRADAAHALEQVDRHLDRVAGFES